MGEDKRRFGVTRAWSRLTGVGNSRKLRATRELSQLASDEGHRQFDGGEANANEDDEKQAVGAPDVEAKTDALADKINKANGFE